jgi:hypothetical protein
MAFNSTLTTPQIVNASIRDTNPVLSVPFLTDYLNYITAIIQNTTDQQVTIATQWSTDGANWSTVGTSTTVAAGSSLVTTQLETVLTALKIMQGYIRLQVTAGVAPTSGAVIATMQGMSS